MAAMECPQDSETVKEDRSDRSTNFKSKQQLDGTQDSQSSAESRASQDIEDSLDSDSTTDNDTTASGEMPPGGKPRTGTPKRDADFSNLLTIGEKLELVALINKITDGMAKQISQAFEKTADSSSTLNSRPSLWSELPNRLKDFSFGPNGLQGKDSARPDNKQNGKENSNPTRPRTANGSPSASNRYGSSRPPPTIGISSRNESKEKDGSDYRSPVLREEALDHLRFKKWQLSVQRRISEISVKKAAETQSSYTISAATSGRSRQRGARNLTITESDPTLAKMYPATQTTLGALPWDKKCLLLHSMLLLLLSLDHYHAYSRVLLLNLTSSLSLPLRILAEDEVRVAKALAEYTKSIPADDIAQKMVEEAKSGKKSKAAMVGLYGGSTSTAGGLAAPLVAAGIGSIPGGLSLGTTAAGGILGSMAEHVLCAGRLFGIGGTKATPKMMDQYVKDVQDFAFKPSRGPVEGDGVEIGKVLPENRRLRVVLGISGWLGNEGELLSPWNVLGDEAEVYGVRWELDTLKKMRNGLATVVKSLAWSLAKSEIQKRATTRPFSKSPCQFDTQCTPRGLTALSMLRTNDWPYDLLRASKNLENPWNVGMVRADKVGSILADMIMNKVQGERGVTLIGFSLGARVIWHCLHCLSERRAVGLVENAVLIGTPGSSDPYSWAAFRGVVSGRLVNVYSENDFLLGFLSRQCHYNYQVAGLQRIENVPGVENVDVSDKVSCHVRYEHLVGSILRHINWEDIDRVQVDKDEECMLMMEEKIRAHERKRDAVELGIVVKEIEEVPQPTSHAPIQTRVRKTKGRRNGGR